MVKKSSKGQPVKGKVTEDELKIKVAAMDEKGKLKYPFFNKYHDESYIVQHGEIKLIVAEEKGMVYRLKNEAQKEIVKYKIDGGLIQSQDDNKCDYGIYTEDKLLILVELKGRHYKHAVTQILSTIEKLKLKDTSDINKLFARVVLSKGHEVPGTKTSDEMKLDRIIKGKGGNVKKKVNLIEENLSDL